MKKKYKLYAWKYIGAPADAAIYFSEGNARPMDKDIAKFCPEFDIEYEKEVPNEVSVPRKFWIAKAPHGKAVAFQDEPSENIKRLSIPVIELLPDHRMISQKEVSDAVNLLISQIGIQPPEPIIRFLNNLGFEVKE